METRPFDLEEARELFKAGKLTNVATKDSHSKVRVLSLDGPSENPVVGIHDGAVECWSASGSYFSSQESSLDLVFTTPREYSDAECDAFCLEAALAAGIRPVSEWPSTHRMIAKYALQHGAKAGR